ncbi:MAG: carbohydrate porin [Pseudomonadota bacterium]
MPESQTIEHTEADESIDSTLEQRDRLVDDPARPSVFPGFYNTFRSWREETKKKFRLESVFSYDMLGQAAVDKQGILGASSGDATLSLRWLMFGQRHHRPVYLSMSVRDRHAYSDIAPSQISAEAGLLWKTVNGFSDAGFQVPDFYVSHESMDQRLTLRFGQFSIDSFYDNHSLRSAKRFFLNQAFSSNPAVGFPGFGAGLALQWKNDGRWDLSIGASNMQGPDQSERVDLKLDSSALFFALQYGYNFPGFKSRSARVQLMAWGTENNSEEQLPDGSGLSLTLEQQGASSNEHFVARYAYSHGDAAQVDQLLMIGWGKDIHTFDHFGIGIGVARPAAFNDTWQGVGEIYYRWQVAKELRITPDVQIIAGDALHGSMQVVAGLRLGITF